MTIPNLPVLFLYFVLVMFTQSIHELVAVRLQRITLFSENCCKGRNESFSVSSRNLDEISDIAASGRMKSFSVHVGLWSLHQFPNFTGFTVHHEGNNDESHGNCGSSATGTGVYTQYKSMKYIGSSMVDLPGLSLFSQNNFQGDELYFDGKELQLSKVLNLKSYGFTGRDSWTIIMRSNNVTNTTCLRAQRGKSVSFDDNEKLNLTRAIRVIRRGCYKTKGDSRPAKHLQVQNGLKLFTKQNKIGDEIFTDGIELRLPKPIKLESHSYIGNKNWTIFTGTRFNGDSDCLVNLNLKDGSSVNQNLTVGSIKRGCIGDPLPEIITPPPEIMDKQTDSSSGFRIEVTAIPYAEAKVLFGFILIVNLMLR